GGAGSPRSGRRRDRPHPLAAVGPGVAGLAGERRAGDGDRGGGAGPRRRGSRDPPGPLSSGVLVEERRRGDRMDNSNGLRAEASSSRKSGRGVWGVRRSIPPLKWTVGATLGAALGLAAMAAADETAAGEGPGEPAIGVAVEAEVEAGMPPMVSFAYAQAGFDT